MNINIEFRMSKFEPLPASFHHLFKNFRKLFKLLWMPTYHLKYAILRHPLAFNVGEWACDWGHKHLIFTVVATVNTRTLPSLKIHALKSRLGRSAFPLIDYLFIIEGCKQHLSASAFKLMTTKKLIYTKQQSTTDRHQARNSL